MKTALVSPTNYQLCSPSRGRLAKSKLLSLLVVTVCWVSACSQRPELSSEEWASLKQQALSDLQFDEGWGAPVLLESMNSLGWEDSAYLSPDGQTLAFVYVPLDLIAWSESSMTDPNAFQTGPLRDVDPLASSDIFISTRNDEGEFVEMQRMPFTADNTAESGANLVEGSSEDWIYASVGAGTGGDDIFLNGEKILGPVNSELDEEDPDLVGDELFFWSHGRVGNDTENDRIYVSKRSTVGNFGEPELLAAPINDASSDNIQPFLRGETLYFTSTRNTGSPQGRPTVWASNRIGEDEWAPPRNLVWMASEESAIAGIGDFCPTEDGTEAILEVVFHYQGKAFDSDLVHVFRQ